MKQLVLVGLFFLSISSGISQIIETILTDPSVTDGMCVDQDGNVYTSSGGLAGYVVGKYDVETGVFDPNHITGLTGPTDVDFLNDSILIITNYDIDAISAYNFNTLELTTIADENLDGPGGIAIDELDNIYISNWGNAPEYNGRTITKITPEGNSWIYVDSDLLYRPQAIGFNHEDELFVHSNNKLYKVNEADSTLELWTDLGMDVSNMVLRKKDSCFYAASVGGNKVLKVDRFGNVEIFAGSSSGYADGDITEAKFQTPLGITFSPGEDTLYISEGGGVERLRRILMTSFTELDTDEKPELGRDVFPNPVQRSQDLHLSDAALEYDRVSFYNVQGKLVRVVFTDDLKNKTIISSQVLQELDKGSYILIFVAENGEYRQQKLLIE